MSLQAQMGVDSSNAFATSALKGVGGLYLATAALPSGKDAVPIVREAGWTSMPIVLYF